MAKGNPSMFEQHIEKGVAGVAGLFLLYALLHWGLGSPITPPAPPPGMLAPDGLTIEKMDNWILGAATAEEKQVADFVPKPKPVPQYAETLRQMLANPMPQQYLAMVDFSNPRVPTSMPGVGPQHEPMSLDDLTKAAPPADQPRINARTICPNRKEKSTDVSAAIGVCVYPWGDLAKAWSEKLKNSGAAADLVVQEIRVERQERQGDGSWSKPAVVPLQPLIVLEGTGGVMPTVAIPRVPDFDGKNFELIRQAKEALRMPQVQQQVIQPMYDDIFWQTTRHWVDWRINLPLTELSNTEGDPLPAEKGPPIPILSGTVPTPSGRPTATPTPLPYEDPMGMGGMGGPAEMPTGTPTPTRRPGATPTPARPTPAAPPMPKMQSLPLLAKQQDNGKMLVWFVDQTMERGKTYRYHVCLRMINPLLACSPNDVKAPIDANSACVETQWSPWSEPVSVNDSASFFLTGSFPTKQEVNVSIFSTCLGQVVRQKTSLRPGQTIGTTEKKVKVFNPGTGLQEEKEVNFSTGSVLVNVDFNKTINGRRMGTEKTVEILYLDPSGTLQRRLLSTDVNTEEYKRLDQAVK